MVNSCCELKCFEDFISMCPDEIKVNAQLEPLHLYKWLITDYHGNKYYIDFETDVDGFGWINPATLPDGFCNPASNGFSIQVLTMDNKPVPMVFPVAYACARIDIVNGGDKNNVG